MFAYKRYIIFFLFLILIPVFIGCTVIGYAIGEGIDDHFAKKHSFNIDNDDNNLLMNNYVVINLLSNTSVEGFVIKVIDNEYLSIIDSDGSTGFLQRQHHVRINFVDIKSITIIDSGNVFRGGGLFLGLITDIFLYAFITFSSAYPADL